eukprot:scaffold29066_cov146-Isochrysis_galbana.AAC.1
MYPASHPKQLPQGLRGSLHRARPSLPPPAGIASHGAQRPLCRVPSVLLGRGCLVRLGQRGGGGALPRQIQGVARVHVTPEEGKGKGGVSETGGHNAVIPAHTPEGASPLRGKGAGEEDAAARCAWGWAYRLGTSLYDVRTSPACTPQAGD